jgi:uncharacterized repeat protein (TIGR01451 family)
MKIRTASVIITLTAMAAATLALAGAPPAAASTPTLAGTSVTVADGPGDSTDPQASGDWVSYTNNGTGSSEINYYNLATGTGASISNDGGNDTLSGISGTTLVYTHEDTSGNFYIDTYDIGSGNPPAVVDPTPGSIRSNPAIGGNTVAWVDYTNDPAAPVIMVDDLATGTVTQLGNPDYPNLEPAVSPDGSVVTWVQCEPAGTPCDVWDAVLGSGGTWTVNQLTDGAASGVDSENPHTDGTIVTYSSNQGGTQDIYWQPAGGGTVQQVPNPDGDIEADPHTNGGLISFQDNDSSGQTNIDVYSLATQTVYQVTSIGSATLADISVTPDGTARVVYEALAAGQYNVYGFIFPVPQEAQSISLTSPPATGIVGGSATLAATGGGSGNPVVFTVDQSSGTGVCNVSGTNGDTVNYTAAGSCVIDANQAGSLDYSAAPTVTVTITVNQAPAFVIDSPPLGAVAGQAYAYTFEASGTPAPTYALASGAPSWLSVNTSTGEVTGTPPAGTTSFSYAVTATNVAGTATAGPFTVTVAKPSTNADISAALACPASMTVGGTGACTLTVANAGPATASKVIAGVLLPAALSEVSCTAGCARHANVFTWSLASLASGASATFAITVKASAAGKVLVLAAAASQNPDPNPYNNISLQQITIKK